MIVINNPIPGVMAVFTASGMDLIIASRSPMVYHDENNTEMNTTTRAWPSCVAIPSTTVYAKNAFNPIPRLSKGTLAYRAQRIVPIKLQYTFR